ncbi:MAG TPA: LamG-like jellyroll fold domain-containing protein [Candidatus Sulfotelmatobacter sp.]|jgi:hypothetical protein|nr:LamG-like jellyroll fold domain-containing protein [Candidatus Sulfotelmatobacter sp.]
MKKIIQLLAVSAVIALGCSISQAQIGYTNSTVGAVLVYSNGYDASWGTANITNAIPIDYSPPFPGALGGSNNPAWLDVLGINDTNAFYGNGNSGTMISDSAILPFTPYTNLVYTLNLSINFSGNPGNSVGGGFCQNYVHQANGQGRFNDNVDGWDWAYLTQSSGAVSWWGGGKTSLGQPGGTFTPHSGTHTLTFILDTTTNQITANGNNGNKWTIAAFIDGNQMGTNYTYASNPTIAGLGTSESALNSHNEFTWTSLTLYASHFLMVTPPVSATVNQGANFTNRVVAGGTPPFGYWWYSNGVAIVNGGNVSGANTNALVISSVLPGNAGSDYYVVVSNSFGMATSPPVSLTVLTNPVFTAAYPVTYTNPMILFGATNISGTNYPGSSPIFSVAASGASPISYQWLTNGVTVGGATNATFSYTNCQLNSATNFACVASNFIGQATNTWSAQYIPSPTAPYPSRVMGYGPVAYWRLNETNLDVNEYNNGEICDEYIGGNNGIYTNTELANSGVGYDQVNDPADTSAIFGYDPSPSDAYSIVGPSVDFSAPTNAEFTVSVWANGGVDNGGSEASPSGMVSKGYFNGEEFSMDNGAAGGDARFEVRNAVGTAYNASSTRQLGGDNTWYHLVGVCDESNGVINLYINGALAGQASIPPGSGLENDSALPIMIGNRQTTANGVNNQFLGALNDVAIFNYALSPAQVAALYGGPITPYFTGQLPPTNVLYTANGPVTIPAFAFGGSSVGYYWTNLNTATLIASGSTNGNATLNATLTLASVSGSWNGDQLELVVTNAEGSTNLVTTVFAATPAQILSGPIIYSNSFALSAGGGWSINGTQPTAINAAFNTNATWICLFTNNAYFGGTVFANGYLGTNGGNAVLPFTPQPGYIYTMVGELTAQSTMGDWVAMGFTELDTQNGVNPGFARFTDNPPIGYTWMTVQNANGTFYVGAGTSTQAGALGTVTIPPVTDTMQLVLNTSTYGTWTASSFINGTQMGTNAVFAAQPINFAGIGQNLNPGVTQWNYWALTQQQVVSLVPTNIMVLQSNSSLYLSWPTDHLGWQLQVQTNSLSTGLGTNWINVAGSALTNQVVIPVNPANGAVFYRLLY